MDRRGAPSAPKTQRKDFLHLHGQRPIVGDGELKHDRTKFPFFKIGDDVRWVSGYWRDFTFF